MADPFDPRYVNPYDHSSGLVEKKDTEGGHWVGDVWVKDEKDDDEKELGFELGGDNVEFLQEAYRDPLAWADNLSSVILRELVATGDALGENKYVMGQFFSANRTQLLQDIDQELFQGKATSGMGRLFGQMTQFAGDLRGEEVGPEFYTSTTAGFNNLVDYARNWFQLRRPDLRSVWEEVGVEGGGGGITDIRAQFDLDQLAAEAQNIYRATLFDEMDDPRGIAREYIDKVVALGGEQKLDFRTFVDKKVAGTARFAAIYRHKPKGMSAAQYIQPYMQTAQQVLGSTQEAVDIGIAGAQFGASSAAFQARLGRTDAVTSSSPFIQNLETRLGDLRKVFKE